MRILFLQSHAGALRNFGSAVAEMAERGHEVRLVFERVKGRQDATIVAELRRRYSKITAHQAPGIPPHLGGPGVLLRTTLDQLRYFEPPFERADALRDRAMSRAPRPMRTAASAGALDRPAVRRAIRRGARRADALLPIQPHVRAALDEHRPELLLVTPLVEFRSVQAEWLRAAHALGIPSALGVHSWDNLTNKGLIHGDPDLVTVWNEAMATEAVDLHGVPRDRVEVIGAHPYDHWFGRQPSSPREEFCSRVGFADDRPYILYLGSSSQIAPQEHVFVRRWVQTLSEHGGAAAEANVLVRPHPLHPLDWASVEGDGVLVWPPLGENPVDDSSRSVYFDSLFHASAVVGLNTSAQVESAILGKPVLTPLVDEFARGQSETVHFRHLLRENGGPVTIGRTLTEHVVQVEEALSRAGEPDPASAGFVASFLRPHGLDRPATPLLVDALEAVAGRGPARPRRVDAAFGAAVQARERLSGISSAGKSPGQSDPIADVVADIDAVLEDPRPILLGPWRGEVGFELLYWIPFVQWALARDPARAEHVTILSRGGTESWYGLDDSGYLDLFEIADGVHLGDEGLTTTIKPLEVPALDRALVERARRAAETDFALLHPSLLFRLYRLLRHRRQLERFEEFSIYRPFRQPAAGRALAAELPDSFYASRFYFNAPFPDTPENRRHAAEVQARLAEHLPVVLLNNGLDLDDHDDVAGSGERILDLSRHMAAKDNLHVQSVIAARSQGAVGTYGGLSYLAPFYGVPSVAYVAEPFSHLRHHLELAQRIFAEPGFGDFEVLDVHLSDLLARVLGGGRDRDGVA